MTNRNEQWKHEKDGLEILKELPALAEKDFKEMLSASSGRASTPSGRVTATFSCASSCLRAS